MNHSATAWVTLGLLCGLTLGGVASADDTSLDDLFNPPVSRTILQGTVEQTIAVPEPASAVTAPTPMSREPLAGQAGLTQMPKVIAPGIVGLDMRIRPNSFPIIDRVFNGSPAQRAGLQPGDRILAVNQQSMLGKTRKFVDAAISDIPGERVLFTIQRQGKTRMIQVTVASLDAVSSDLRSEYLPTLTLWPLPKVGTH